MARKPKSKLQNNVRVRLPKYVCFQCLRQNIVSGGAIDDCDVHR